MDNGIVKDLDYIAELNPVQLNDVVNAANRYYDSVPRAIGLYRITFEDYLIDADYWIADMINYYRGGK